jgi:hypothetical protein
LKKVGDLHAVQLVREAHSMQLLGQGLQALSLTSLYCPVVQVLQSDCSGPLQAWQEEKQGMHMSYSMSGYFPASQVSLFVILMQVFPLGI